MRPGVERLEGRLLLTQYGGVEFPQGATSFADEVLFYRPVGTIVAHAKVPEKALGTPDYNGATNEGIATLGQGGEIGLKFIDNLLTNSGTTDNDLWIFEVGPDVEASFISVRPTAATQALLNATLDSDGFAALLKIQGSTRGIDLDAIFPGHDAGALKFDAVKIVDDASSGEGSGSTPGADIDSVGAITSQALQPKITITATDNLAKELGQDTATFAIRRTGPLDQELQVRLRYSSTATNGVDYQTLPTTITIPANTSRFDLVLKPIDDSLPEPSEVARVTILEAGELPIDANAGYAVARILDNDTPVVALSALDSSAAESVVGAPTSGAFLLQRDSTQIGSAVTVVISVGGSATYGTDYTITATGGTLNYNAQTKRLSVTLAANARYAMIYINALNDRVDESTENVVLSLLADATYRVSSTKKTGTVAITDNPLTGR